MAENTNTSLTAEAWAEITIKIWQDKIRKYNIKNTGALLRSFHHHVNTAANGNPDLIKFVYEFYGIFVDLGVGGIVDLENRNTLVSTGVTKRRRKPWYTDVFALQLKKLSELMAEKHAMKGANLIVQTAKTDTFKNE